MSGRVHRSTLALVVLALLRNEPMHPYQMQVRIKEWAKDKVVNVKQRSSLYRTIERLEAGGLVEVRATERERLRPERTVYAITDAGQAVLHTWHVDMLANPAEEFPELPAALSIAVMLEPAELASALEQRLERLEAAVQELGHDANGAGVGIPRPFLLEVELVLAKTVAERDWVAGVVDDLRSGRLTWDEEWLRSMAERFSTEEGGELTDG
jgi:DNA-binding PadR family transcriptional regulator